MCRIFAYRSNNESVLNHFLVNAENAIINQSREHQDGWGLAYYLQSLPHLVKGMGPAHKDREFSELSARIQSDTVLAHIRKKTQGELSITNCHPFQIAEWVMAHNGDIPAYQHIKEALKDSVNQKLRSAILGSTDSEVYFAFLLSQLLADAFDGDARSLALSVRKAIDRIDKLASGFLLKEECSLNFVLTNGKMMAAYRRGKDLHYAAYKGLQASPCAASIKWPKNIHQEQLKEGNRISHLLISSESIMANDMWHPMENNQLIIFDSDWRLWRKL